MAKPRPLLARPDPEEALPASPLARLRLLVALDALLVAGSVSGAAKALDISPPAASRMLSQLRDLFGDDLLVRSGRSMVPTALAETLRLRVRALASEADALVHGEVGAVPVAPPVLPGDALAVPLQLAPHHRRPRLALRGAGDPDGYPSEQYRAQRLSSIGPGHDPHQRLAGYVATVGAGRGRVRPLDETEAEDAFGIIIGGEADPIQVGALLVAIQYRGITPGELTGMVRAARRGLPPLDRPGADLDWPAYLSPRNHHPPWFLLAARLLGDAGYRVLLHGLGDGLSPYDSVLAELGIPMAPSLADAGALLNAGGGGCVHMSLPAILPQLQALVNLYQMFQMRSPIHHGLQLLNPLAAPATVMGVPGPGLTSLHHEAAAALGWGRLLCIDSHRDVAQATPHRLMRLALGGAAAEIVVPPGAGARPGSAPPGYGRAEYCAAVWSGQERDTDAIATVIDSAALGLVALCPDPPDFAAARARARQLWDARQT